MFTILATDPLKGIFFKKIWKNAYLEVMVKFIHWYLPRLSTIFTISATQDTIGKNWGKYVWVSVNKWYIDFKCDFKKYIFIKMYPSTGLCPKKSRIRETLNLSTNADHRTRCLRGGGWVFFFVFCFCLFFG